MDFGWLELSGIEASLSLTAAPYSRTESDAKLPRCWGFPLVTALRDTPSVGERQ